MVDDCRHAEILLDYGSIAAYLDSVFGNTITTCLSLDLAFNDKLREMVKAHEVARMWQPKHAQFEAEGHARSEIRYHEWFEARSDNCDAIIQAVAADLLNDRLDGETFFMPHLIEWVAGKLHGVC